MDVAQHPNETRSLAGGVHLVTDFTDDGSGGGTADRSSIWRAADHGSFAIVFHQGTPADVGGIEPPIPEED